MRSVAPSAAPERTGDIRSGSGARSPRRSRLWCAWRRSWAFAVVAVTAAFSVEPQPAFREHEVEAVFLYNFGKFVSWPESAFAGAKSPFVIGLVGRSEVGEFLKKTARDGEVRGRRLEIREIGTSDEQSTIAEMGRCHVLFIGRSSSEALPKIIAKLAREPVLTVSDTPGFADIGGVIGFVVGEKKVALEFDLAAAKAARLKLSSKLLRVGRIVRREDGSQVDEASK